MNMRPFSSVSAPSIHSFCRDLAIVFIFSAADLEPSLRRLASIKGRNCGEDLWPNKLAPRGN